MKSYRPIEDALRGADGLETERQHKADDQGEHRGHRASPSPLFTTAWMKILSCVESPTKFLIPFPFSAPDTLPRRHRQDDGPTSGNEDDETAINRTRGSRKNMPARRWVDSTPPHDSSPPAVSGACSAPPMDEGRQRQAAPDRRFDLRDVSLPIDGFLRGRFEQTDVACGQPSGASRKSSDRLGDRIPVVHHQQYIGCALSFEVGDARGDRNHPKHGEHNSKGKN